MTAEKLAAQDPTDFMTQLVSAALRFCRSRRTGHCFHRSEREMSLLAFVLLENVQTGSFLQFELIGFSRLARTNQTLPFG